MIVQKVLNYVVNNKLIEANEHIVVGVSGGADSICLLFVLKKIQSIIPFTISVVHVEHGIRGEESRQDAEFVKNICMVYDLSFRQYSYDVIGLAKAGKVSVEEAARKVRYESFWEAVGEIGAAKVAVAHHKNDQAETILWNMLRGTGLKGLGGMSPLKEMQGVVIRPLLCLTREEIECCLKENEIFYRQDSTNLETDYTRNKIRLELLPYVEKKLNAKAIKHIAAIGDSVREANEFIQSFAHEKYQTIAAKVNGNVSISVSKLRQEEHIIQTYIIRQGLFSLKTNLKNIDNTHIESLVHLCSLQVGKEVHLPEGIRGRREYDSLILLKTSKGTKEMMTAGEEKKGVQIPGKVYFLNFMFDFSVEKYEGEEYRKRAYEIKNQKELISQKKYTMWLDYDKIKFSPELRVRTSGDYIMINNLGGRKKLKSFFIDEKISREERSQIPLLCLGNEVIWVVGHRLSEKYKITNETKTILKIQADGGTESGR